MKYLVFLLFFLGLQAHAHGIRLFASYDGDRLTGRAYSGSKGIAKVTISLMNTDGTLHSQVTTDKDGNFGTIMTERVPIKLVLALPDGHKTSYDLEWSKTENADRPHTHADADHDHNDGDEQELVRLRKQINMLQSQRRMLDILGGIGFVFGLAGILMMVKSRKKS